MSRLRASFVVCSGAAALAAMFACGRTTAMCGEQDQVPSGTNSIVAGPVAFVPRSITAVRLFSNIRAVIVSQAADACQEYKEFHAATDAPAEARWLEIDVAPGVGEGAIDHQPPTATAEVQRYCPGDFVFNGGTVVVAEGGQVDVTGYAEGDYIVGTYNLSFAGGSTVTGSFDASFCDTD